MNHAQLHLENDMFDKMMKMYNKLGEEGYHGGYRDARTDELEADFNKIYWWAVGGSAKFDDFVATLKEFYFYYKTKANKIDPDTASLEWARERMKNK